MHNAPIAAVPTSPKIRPPFLNAFGMARIPDPRLLLIKCSKAPLSLIGQSGKNVYNVLSNIFKSTRVEKKIYIENGIHLYILRIKRGRLLEVK